MKYFGIFVLHYNLHTAAQTQTSTGWTRDVWCRQRAVCGCSCRAGHKRWYLGCAGYLLTIWQAMKINLQCVNRTLSQWISVYHFHILIWLCSYWFYYFGCSVLLCVCLCMSYIIDDWNMYRNDHRNVVCPCQSSLPWIREHWNPTSHPSGYLLGWGRGRVYKLQCGTRAAVNPVLTSGIILRVGGNF